MIWRHKMLSVHRYGWCWQVACVRVRFVPMAQQPGPPARHNLRRPPAAHAATMSAEMARKAAVGELGSGDGDDSAKASARRCRRYEGVIASKSVMRGVPSRRPRACRAALQVCPPPAEQVFGMCV